MQNITHKKTKAQGRKELRPEGHRRATTEKMERIGRGQGEEETRKRKESKWESSGLLYLRWRV